MAQITQIAHFCERDRRNRRQAISVSYASSVENKLSFQTGNHTLHRMVMRFYRQLIEHLEREADPYREGRWMLLHEGIVVPSSITEPITRRSERKAGNKDHVEGAGVEFVARWMLCAVDAWNQVLLTLVAVMFQHPSLQGLRGVDGDAVGEEFIKKGIEVHLRTHGKEAVQRANVAIADQLA